MLARAASLLATVGFALAFPAAPELTAYQRQFLTKTREQAISNSRAAEASLLATFRSHDYQREVSRVGDARLAALSPEETLSRLKLAMDSIEFATSFGLTPAQLRLHPEMATCCATPNITTLDGWGYYPNAWQLLAVNSSLAAEVPLGQFEIYDASETSLYGLKQFAHDPATSRPTWAEAAERNVYVSVNLQRHASGIEYFGPYALVWRQSVVRQRALVIASDDGHWQFACNKSLHPPTRKWWWPIAFLAYDCTAMGGKGYKQPGFRPPAAMNGAELHTLARNAQTFRHLGTTLPRLLVQLLSPQATAEPVEQYFYTEAALAGAGRISDAKVILASFQPLFGTPEGDQLVAFCRNYSLPLLWGLGIALSPHEQSRWQKLPIGFSRPTTPIGAPRLLDPATLPFTNASSVSQSAAVWDAVVAKAKSYRQVNNETQHAAVVAWWNELATGGTGVRPLFGGECAETDLAIGTSNLTGLCIMRNDPHAAQVVAEILV